MKRTQTLVAAVCLCLCCVTCANSQGVRAGRDGVKLSGFGDVDLQKTVDYWANREQAHIRSQIILHVDLMTAACELEEDAVAKLRLAAEGVAARRLAIGRQQLEQFIYESNLVARESGDTEVKPKPDDEDTLFTSGAGKVGGGIVFIRAEFKTPVLEHPLWLKLLRSSLSDEQWRKYEVYSVKRNRSFLSAAVASQIADLDAVIFLSDQQRAEIRAEVMDLLGPQVTPRRPASIEQARSMTEPVFDQLDRFRAHLRPAQATRLIELQQNVPNVATGWSAHPAVN